MKLLFIARSTLFTQPGGDSQQIVQTVESLKSLGHQVDIKLNGENIDFTTYDLVHFFNIGRPADIIHHLENINLPFVVSSIWVDYTEWNKLQDGWKGLLAKILSPFKMEYLKTVARGVNGSDRFPNFKFLARGQKKSMVQILNRADVVISSSESEKNRLSKAFDCGDKTVVLPLGLPNWIFDSTQKSKKEGVLCVGRIEGLKNQLNLIIAANSADWQLTIAGKATLNQPKYMVRCQIAAKNNVHFAGWLDGEHLKQAYQNAKVLVLPSYFETFGLVALEAYANGCNLVLSDRADMNDIFKDKALFCNPNDPQDIKQKVDEALELAPPIFSQFEREKHNWSNIAKDLERIYLNCKKQYERTK